MNKSNFEELLDCVLREDAQVEPLAGFEERVIQRVMAPPQRHSIWRFIAWGVAVVTPVFLVAVMLIPKQRSSAKQTHFVAETRLSRLPPNTGAVTAGNRTETVHAAVKTIKKRTDPLNPTMSNGVLQRVEPLPKLDVFPTPTQVQETVRELAELSHRQGEISGVAEFGLQGKPPTELKVEPITIAAIVIEPVFPLPNGAGKNDDQLEIR